MKKILAGCISIVLTLSLLCACSDDDTSKKSSSASAVTNSSDGTSKSTEEASEEETTEVPDPSLTENGEPIDTENLVMCTIDGNDVSFDEYRYNYYYFVANYGSSFGVTADEMADLDEDEKQERFDTLKENIMTFMKGTYVYMKYAADNGISLTDEEKKECGQEISKIKEEEKDGYSDYLKQRYLTEDYFKKLIEQTKLAGKVQKSFDLSDDEFLDVAEDDLILVKHIMIPFGYDITPSDETLKSMGVTNFSSMTNVQKMSVLPTAFKNLSNEEQEKEKKKAKQHAEEIYKKAKGGEDFDSLIKEYGFDGGMDAYSGGYLLGDFYTTYDESFTKASIALETGELSQPVETSYGYHIIKRVPVDREYIKANIENEDSENTFKDEYVSSMEYDTLKKLMDSVKVEESDVLKNLKYGDLK